MELTRWFDPEQKEKHPIGVRNCFIGATNVHFHANDIENPLHGRSSLFFGVRGTQMGCRSLLAGKHDLSLDQWTLKQMPKMGMEWIGPISLQKHRIWLYLCGEICRESQVKPLGLASASG